MTDLHGRAVACHCRTQKVGKREGRREEKTGCETYFQERAGKEQGRGYMCSAKRRPGHEPSPLVSEKASVVLPMWCKNKRRGRRLERIEATCSSVCFITELKGHAAVRCCQRVLIVLADNESPVRLGCPGSSAEGSVAGHGLCMLQQQLTPEIDNSVQVLHS